MILEWSGLSALGLLELSHIYFMKEFILFLWNLSMCEPLQITQELYVDQMAEH